MFCKNFLPTGSAMIDIQTNKRLCNFFLWLMAGLVLVIILTSCSPYQGLQIASPTATADPTRPAQIRPSPSPTPSPITCTVTTGYQAGTLNMRSGPGTSWAVLRVLIEAESLQVTRRGAWLQVIDRSGARGYVNAKYCQVQP